MRDTIIGILVLLSVIGGYYAFRSKTEILSTSQTTPNIVSNNSSKTPEIAKSPVAPAPKQISRKHLKLNRKAIHERAKHSRTRPLQDDEHHSRSETTLGEVEKLPSIYEDQEGRQPELNSGEGTKSLYGVPVEAWVLSHQNSISSEPADPKLAEGVRVYLGCIELKKEGAKELTKSDCAKIAARDTNVR